MPRPTKDELERDQAFWEPVGKPLGWKLRGFDRRYTATFDTLAGAVVVTVDHVRLIEAHLANANKSQPLSQN